MKEINDEKELFSFQCYNTLLLFQGKKKQFGLRPLAAHLKNKGFQQCHTSHFVDGPVCQQHNKLLNNPAKDCTN